MVLSYYVCGKKVSSAIGVLGKLRQFVNDDALITIDNSLIQASFDYSDTVGDTTDDI